MHPKTVNLMFARAKLDFPTRHIHIRDFVELWIERGGPMTINNNKSFCLGNFLPHLFDLFRIEEILITEMGTETEEAVVRNVGESHLLNLLDRLKSRLGFNPMCPETGKTLANLVVIDPLVTFNDQDFRTVFLASLLQFGTDSLPALPDIPLDGSSRLFIVIAFSHRYIICLESLKIGFLLLIIGPFAEHLNCFGQRTRRAFEMATSTRHIPHAIPLEEPFVLEDTVNHRADFIIRLLDITVGDELLDSPSSEPRPVAPILVIIRFGHSATEETLRIRRVKRQPNARHPRKADIFQHLRVHDTHFLFRKQTGFHRDSRSAVVMNLVFVETRRNG